MSSVRFSDRLRAADDALFAALARSRSPALDRALPAISQAANLSRLWIACAALLALAGGPKGKRAARRGLLSLGITSAVVNLVLKPLFRRTRPSLRGVPAVRRLRRQPRTTAFPSGHAASAAAFATGASVELPAAAPALGALAGAVAVSRIYTGVHHPTDVAAGVAVGAGVALLARRIAIGLAAACIVVVGAPAPASADHVPTAPGATTRVALVPAAGSRSLTLGPPGSGVSAAAGGYARLSVFSCPGCDSLAGQDPRLIADVIDVRRNGRADYDGMLLMSATVRIPGDPNAADVTLQFPLECTPTASEALGSTCEAFTTAAALIPGVVPPHRKTTWELGAVRVLGPGDGPFLVRGVVLP